MGNDDKITAHQLAVLAFIGLLSPVIRILPRLSVSLAGSASWLSVVPGTAAGLLYILFLKRAFKNKMPGEGLYHIIRRSAGAVGGGAAAVVSVLWLILYGGFITRAASERMLSAVYQSGTTPMFIAVILAVALVASSGTVRALVRTGEIVVLVILSALALVTLFSLKQVRAEFLLPVSFSDAGRIAAGALPVAEITGTGVFFYFLTGHVEDGENTAKSTARFFLLEMLCVFAVTLVTVGSFAPELVLKYQSPFFMVVRNITALGVIERVEALVIAMWILTDFMLLASVITVAGEIMSTLFGTKSTRLFKILTAVACALTALFMVRDEFTLQMWSNFYIPGINIAFAFIFIPAMLLIGILRKKI